MNGLEEILGYRFQDAGLLETALTHSSYANEHHVGHAQCNERLEFLGDSVLGMVVADYLFRQFGQLPEGDLTRMRASLVCEDNLVLVAGRWKLGQFLLLGRGEEMCGGRERPSIQADAVEAVLAAVYLDGGIAQARRLIHRFILDDISHIDQLGRDYKTSLQELIQRKSGQVLTYQLIDQTGPDHAKVFHMQVSLNGVAVGEGSGHSKKDAEQAAAKAALAVLEQN